MAANNFEACLAHTLKFEGGYVDHPADPGGATNLGITLATLRAWRKTAVTKADVRALTKAEAAQIYRANYWNAVGADTLPFGVDLCAFDEGVNSGPARGKARVKAAQAKYSNPLDIIRAMCAGRRAFFQSLRTFKVFGKGWMSRVAQVEAAATRMALTATGMPAPDIARKMQTEASTAAQKAKTKAGQAKAAGGTATAGGIATSAGGWNWEAIIFVGVCVGVLLFITILIVQGVIAENARKEAFQEVANNA